MGKKLDAFLGRGFKISKFKATVALAISRSAVLKNQRQARCSIVRSDVVEFLKSGNHDRALLRVEQVIKEQNMLDVLDVLEGYSHLLIERIHLIEQERDCPEELKEAAATLIFASTRCGDFPELREIRAIFISRFGKEFVARAVELRNNCGVNPKIIQKLSTRMPSLENRMKVLKEIASDNDIDLPMEETLSETITEHQAPAHEKQHKPCPSSLLGVSDQWENKPTQPDEIGGVGDFSDSIITRTKYKDVADAAQAAFESAAYAAAAARVAVELSRSGSTDPDDPKSPNIRPRKVCATIHDPMKDQEENSKSEKIHPVQSYDLESTEGSSEVDKGMEQFEPNESGTEMKRSYSASSSDSLDYNMKWVVEEGQIKQKDVMLDESDDEGDQKSRILGRCDFDAGRKNDSTAQVALKMALGPGNTAERLDAEKITQKTEPLNINRRPISVRTRRAHGR